MAARKAIRPEPGTMDEPIKSALKNGILQCTRTLREKAPQFQRTQFVWRQSSDGGWLGDYREGTWLVGLFKAAEALVQKEAANFESLFFSKYPHFGPGKLVLIPGLMGEQLSRKGLILERALSYLWKRNENFDWNESAIDELVADFEDFVEKPTVPIRFQSQLLNFAMETPAVQLGDAVRIRKMSAQELSNLHNDATRGAAPDMRTFRVHEFVMEADYQARCLKGEQNVKDADLLEPQRTANDIFGKAILCLRTFKEGPVGYNSLHFRFPRFCPMVLPSIGFFDRYVKPGVYTISANEVSQLREHSLWIFSLTEAALDSACVRLADAEARLRAQDQILDAVIGMEALLLAGLRSDERRGELRFRFSMNYASLFDSPEERRRAYRVAKSLYDYRSTIAHGSKLANDKLRVADEELNLHQVAQRSTTTLRSLIKRFLPHGESAPYRNPAFWESKYFGLPELAEPNK